MPASSRIGLCSRAATDIDEYVLIYQPDDVDPIRLEDAGSTVFMKRPHGLGEPSGSE